MEQSASSEQATRERTATVIGSDVVIWGDIEGPTDLQLHGKVTGKVVVVGLMLDEKAQIEGAVTADAVVISGRVVGPIEARTVHLTSTARVEGDVTYASLQIEMGARLSGRCEFSDGAERNVVRFADPAARDVDAKSDLTDSSQELVRLTARLRRAAE